MPTDVIPHLPHRKTSSFVAKNYNNLLRENKRKSIVDIRIEERKVR